MQPNWTDEDFELDPEPAPVQEEPGSAGRRFKRQLLIILSIITLFWLLELADWLLWHTSLDAYGIRPRTWVGLRQILFAPFLHVGFGHVAANSVPFFALGMLVLLRSTRDFVIVSLLALGTSGLGVWLIAPDNTVHLGASGVVFGYLGYLWARGAFERSVPAISAALIATLLYGGIWWGILPGQVGVSWQGHLFGFLGGILAAYLLANTRR